MKKLIPEVFCRFNEVIVAKRRNLKKEKAERNKAYARQFNKSGTGRFSRRRYDRSSRSSSTNNSSTENQEE
ncbi:hypothetical protein NIES593_02160 [Hydrococcus rivularis NIES-593]|uniref:Uncharacterized protein n=1 Tax=Hydrococcus rivularis NIES-593 TaxID=1921803 RepID=A0A1U7HTF6_9CYAN|nr:hypothetical protein NIES593_02160 [Hydrococcus rivularis NIES-593]